MNKKKYLVPYILLVLLFLMGTVYAATPNGEYLQYQAPKPAESSSMLSMVTYVFSLMVTFALVIGLAYFASRFVGRKMGSGAVMGPNKVIATLSLGANRGVYIVEIAGKFLALGVTDHGISVLHEITDLHEIEKMKEAQLSMPETQFDKVFQRQLASLQRLSPKFPNVFKSQLDDEEKHKGEKR